MQLSFSHSLSSPGASSVSSGFPPLPKPLPTFLSPPDPPNLPPLSYLLPPKRPPLPLYLSSPSSGSSLPK